MYCVKYFVVVASNINTIGGLNNEALNQPMQILCLECLLRQVINNNFYDLGKNLNLKTATTQDGIAYNF